MTDATAGADQAGGRQIVDRQHQSWREVDKRSAATGLHQDEAVDGEAGIAQGQCIPELQAQRLRQGFVHEDGTGRRAMLDGLRCTCLQITRRGRFVGRRRASGGCLLRIHRPAWGRSVIGSGHTRGRTGFVGCDGQFTPQRVVMADGKHRSQLRGGKCLVLVFCIRGRRGRLGHGHAGKRGRMCHPKPQCPCLPGPILGNRTVGTKHQIAPQQVQGLFVQCTIQPINKESDGGHGGHCHQQGHQQQIQLTGQQVAPQQQEGQAQGRGTRGSR